MIPKDHTDIQWFLNLLQTHNILYHITAPFRPSPNPGKQEHGLQKLRKEAEQKKFVCLTTEYYGMRAKYNYQCQLGHTFQKSAMKVLQAVDCPVCLKL